MIFTVTFATTFGSLAAILMCIGVAAGLFAGSLYFNHRIDQQEDSKSPTPVEYLVVIGVAYTILAMGLIAWWAALLAVVAFAISGLPMLYGARRRESWRRERADAEAERVAEANRQALLKRTGGDDA